MIHPRRYVQVYWVAAALIAALLTWWAYFFFRQGDLLLARMQREGVPLSPEQAEAMRTATRESLRMFLFEGGFLALLVLGSIWLVLRALQRELALERQQKNFLSAVTHELRSPIASARLYLESLLLGRAEGEKRERYLQHALQDLDRLRGQVEGLLETARLSAAAPVLKLEPLDLAGFARDVVGRLAQEDDLRALAVELHANGAVPVSADRSALETILRNLLSNAAKYGGREPRVELRVEREDGAARLAVRDFGPGLGGVDPKAIFQPFLRGETARSKSGVGLGLFLVERLTHALGGDVRAEDGLQGGGTRIEVRLPLANPGAVA